MLIIGQRSWQWFTRPEMSRSAGNCWAQFLCICGMARSTKCFSFYMFFGGWLSSVMLLLWRKLFQKERFKLLSVGTRCASAFQLGQEFQAAKARVDRRALRQAKAPSEASPMEQKAALAAYGTEAGPKELILAGFHGVYWFFIVEFIIWCFFEGWLLDGIVLDRGPKKTLHSVKLKTWNHFWGKAVFRAAFKWPTG